MAASRPPLLLRALIGASLAGGLFPAGFAVWSVRDWAAHWAGRPIGERRAAFAQVPWLRAPFPELAAFLRGTLPKGARVLVEPVIDPAVSERPALSPPRWHVFLAHYAYPVRFYVRAPELSCVGFRHEAWLDHHFEVLDLDGSEGGPREERLEPALASRGIEWRLRIPVRGAGPELYALDRLVEGAWKPVPLPEARR
jgi:hypothetical protein